MKKLDTYTTTVALFKDDVESFKTKYHFNLSTFFRLCLRLAINKPAFFYEVLNDPVD